MFAQKVIVKCVLHNRFFEGQVPGQKTVVETKCERRMRVRYKTIILAHTVQNYGPNNMARTLTVDHLEKKLPGWLQPIIYQFKYFMW